MKLLVQSDDYGISRAVSLGIIHGIKHGMIRNTGAFTNMPWSDECLEWILPYRNQIALGIDLNITTGRPLYHPAKLSTLVREDGTFRSSFESRALDTAENDFEHVDVQEVRLELEEQIQHFIRLTGRKPDYVHPHAYVTPRILQVEREIAQEYGVPFSMDCFADIFGYNPKAVLMPWYKKPATPENQLASSLKQHILNLGNDFLSREYGLLVGHMGYVDCD